MAKTKKQVSKTPKKHSPKYGKIAATCSKELAAKKTALAKAEKALAKAQKTHSELLSEVARLDMLDRSLKALINGTEPPQNVRYVYNYPQWVWYPYNGYGWHWNGNTYSVTLGAQSGGSIGSFQGGQFSYNTSGAITTNNAVNIATPYSGNLTLSNCSIPSSVSSASSSFMNCSDSSLNGVTLTNSGSIPSAGPATSYTLTTTADQHGTTYTLGNPNPDVTVDLSTGQADPDEIKDFDKAVAAAVDNSGKIEAPEQDMSFPDETHYPLTAKVGSKEK